MLAEAYVTIGQHINEYLEANPGATVAHALVALEIPVTPVIGGRLSVIAKAVADGRLSLAECPQSYAVAYGLAKLSQDRFKLAQALGLVRPNVTKKEFIALIGFRDR